MLSDVDLWITLIEQANRLIQTKTDLDKLTKFENNNNRTEIGYINSTRLTPEEMANTIIVKPFLKHFSNYVENKIKEQGLKELDLEKEEKKRY